MRTGGMFMKMTIGSFLSKRALLSPTKEALVIRDIRLNYKQLNQRCNQFVNAVKNMGVGRGDRLAILSLNKPEYSDTPI